MAVRPLSEVTVVDVRDNEAESRFEAVVDGHLAELTYRRNGNRLVLVHTGVPDELEGQGVGAALVRAAVDHAADTGATVVPHCSFVRSWLERHPDEQDRISIDWPS